MQMFNNSNTWQVHHSQCMQHDAQGASPLGCTAICVQHPQGLGSHYLTPSHTISHNNFMRSSLFFRSLAGVGSCSCGTGRPHTGSTVTVQQHCSTAACTALYHVLIARGVPKHSSSTCCSSSVSLQLLTCGRAAAAAAAAGRLLPLPPAAAAPAARCLIASPLPSPAAAFPAAAPTAAPAAATPTAAPAAAVGLSWGSERGGSGRWWAGLVSSSLGSGWFRAEASSSGTGGLAAAGTCRGRAVG
eukprot:CAMPEP_0202899556 /NCGR_PEP_ID=MMETSP1392-20130828/7757_1 /ASSEMBLY_ACC=CAM_ASM_000868 /TAXON_ID=225041 /ORGANISM="Chlamydomonas chlamydogama, Strain SAG 11-48b" /LENGTH=243 /DNA_ID=CAMNT_0049585765 /DNA_START=564 /DNA_END=1295 /DNA_ORIENTATION=-